MKTIDVCGYSGEWVAKALAAMRKDGAVQLQFRDKATAVAWGCDGNDETRLVQAAAKLKGGAK